MDEVENSSVRHGHFLPFLPFHIVFLGFQLCAWITGSGTPSTVTQPVGF